MRNKNAKAIEGTYWLRVAFALLCSMLFHFWVMTNTQWRLPDLDHWLPKQTPAEQTPIHLDLLRPLAQPEPIAPELSPKPVPQAKRTRARKQSAAAQPTPILPPTPLAMPLAAVGNAESPLVSVVPSSLPEADATETNAQTKGLDESQAAEKDAASEEASNPIEAPTTKTTVPTQLALEYEVFRDKTKIGVAEVRYQQTEGHQYQLYSERRAVGIAAAFVKSKDIEQSTGIINAHGLQPQQYTHQLGKEGRKLHRAEFDWAQSQLTLHDNEVTHIAPLPEHTQDMLSFMYQFMFVPPLDNMQPAITNGRKLQNYTYRFVGEEVISTRLGEMNTQHIEKLSGDVTEGDAEEKLELWLGIDYHYLPIKIRKTEKDGTVYEQIISSVQMRDTAPTAVPTSIENNINEHNQ